MREEKGIPIHRAIELPVDVLESLMVGYMRNPLVFQGYAIDKPIGRVTCWGTRSGEVEVDIEFADNVIVVQNVERFAGMILSVGAETGTWLLGLSIEYVPARKA